MKNYVKPRFEGMYMGKIKHMFSRDVLAIDVEEAVSKITAAIREQVKKQLARRGAVVAISGGIDSSVTAALCVEALGKDNVFGLFLPERDSASESTGLGEQLASHFGIDSLKEDITPILDGAGCYKRRDEAIRRIFPDYDASWKCKIVLPQNLLEEDRMNVFSIVVQSPAGEQFKEKLPLREYQQIVAASNMKQRTRKMLEYYHAERLHYAVAGTPNRLEYDQGFFVKGGDGLADIKPIAHLYKTQVYEIARYLNIPEDIRKRPPITDTYSLHQTQEEFFFCLPTEQLDLFLWAVNHEIPAEDVGQVLGLSEEQVLRVYKDIEAKRRNSKYLHAMPLLVEEL